MARRHEYFTNAVHRAADGQANLDIFENTPTQKLESTDILAQPLDSQAAVDDLLRDGQLHFERNQLDSRASLSPRQQVRVVLVDAEEDDR